VRGARPSRHLEEHAATALALSTGETVLVAASGGPDSTALAALAAGAASRGGATVVLAHVNHGVRSGAWQDEAVVLALGQTLGLRVLTASLPPGVDAAEAALREGRYAALAAMARRAGAGRVVTGQHAEDQTETVLLALFRGAGPGGIGGMRTVRPLEGDLTLCRPLLRISPADLRAYCLERALPYARDPSNADAAYRRNAVRAALAGLRDAFPGLDEAVARYAELARDEADDTRRAGLRRALRDALAESGGTRDVTFERIEAAVRLVEGGREGRVAVKDGVELRVGRP
jgi:tRNA(Ile)-lysidine synthase